MAKINARGAHRVGPTLFTEKTRPADARLREDVPTVYREAWRLRSDGVVQTRIIETRPADGFEGRITRHSSTFRTFGTLLGFGGTNRDRVATQADFDKLRERLTRRGYTVVEESWR